MWFAVVICSAIMNTVSSSMSITVLESLRQWQQLRSREFGKRLLG